MHISIKQKRTGGGVQPKLFQPKEPLRAKTAPICSRLYSKKDKIWFSYAKAAEIRGWFLGCQSNAQQQFSSVVLMSLTNKLLLFLKKGVGEEFLLRRICVRSTQSKQTKVNRGGGGQKSVILSEHTLYKAQ